MSNKTLNSELWTLGGWVWHKELGPVILVGSTCVPNAGTVTLFRFDEGEHQVSWCNPSLIVRWSERPRVGLPAPKKKVP